jgi:phage protein U
MYAQLGPIQFTPIKGFSSVSSTRETNLVEHALIEGKPKLQRVGTNLTTLEIVMLLDAAFCDPQSEIDALNNSRELAEVMPLVMGDGRVVGNFVIRAVSDNQLNHTKEGTITQAEVTVSLVEYAGADTTEAAASIAIAAAFANVNNAPATYIPVAVPISIEHSATQGLVNANAGINTTVDNLTGLTGYVDLYRPKAETVIQDMIAAGDQLNDVLQTINADPLSEMYDRTRDLALVIEQTLNVTADITTEAEALIQDIENGDVSSAAARVAELGNKAQELDTKSSQISQTSAALISLVVVQ